MFWPACHNKVETSFPEFSAPLTPQQCLARLGARTHGIDASESNISIAKVYASADPKLSPPSPLLSYEYTSAESLLTSPKRYDVVCSMEVLEHVDNPASFLSTCATLVKVSPRSFILFPYSSPFQNKDSISVPWIRTNGTYLPRTQAEVRGLIYNPFQARWHLAARDAWGATDCNYLFWVRKPALKSSDGSAAS